MPLSFSIHHGLAWHTHGGVAGEEGGEAKSSRASCVRIAAICVLFEEMIRVYFIARKGCQPL